jgi:iron complex transport system ATP-binding protein
LTIKDLAFRYETVPVLENITFDLLPGQLLALIGPNGAGRSTLLKCINGLLRLQKQTAYHRLETTLENLWKQ